MPPLPPARTMGTSPEGAGRAESLVRARAAAVRATSSTRVALEDLEALGAGERLVAGLHAGVAVGDAQDVEAGPDLVVRGEEAVGVRDEDPAAAVADADLDLGDGVAGGAGGVVGPGEELELAGLVDGRREGALAAVVAGERAEGDGAGAAPAFAGDGGGGPGGGEQAGLGEVGGVGEPGGLAVDDADAGAPGTAGGELLDAAVIEDGAGRDGVLGEDLGHVAAGLQAVERTRSSTSGSMRAVSVTAVS